MKLIAEPALKAVFAVALGLDEFDEGVYIYRPAFASRYMLSKS